MVGVGHPFIMVCRKTNLPYAHKARFIRVSMEEKKKAVGTCRIKCVLKCHYSREDIMSDPTAIKTM